VLLLPLTLALDDGGDLGVHHSEAEAA